MGPSLGKRYPTLFGQTEPAHKTKGLPTVPSPTRGLPWSREDAHATMEHRVIYVLVLVCALTLSSLAQGQQGKWPSSHLPVVTRPWSAPHPRGALGHHPCI